MMRFLIKKMIKTDETPDAFEKALKELDKTFFLKGVLEDKDKEEENK